MMRRTLCRRGIQGGAARRNRQLTEDARAGVNAALRYPTKARGGVILAKVASQLHAPAVAVVFHKSICRIMLRKRHFESQYENAKRRQMSDHRPHALRVPVKLKKRTFAKPRTLKTLDEAMTFLDIAYPAILFDDRAYALLNRLMAAQRSGIRQAIDDASLDLELFLKDRRLI